MQYRKFGSLEWPVSALGFGCMRFPLTGTDNSQIDEKQSTGMLAYALERGVNYIDTAYTYHGGQSERFVGKFLKSGYRDKVRLATKLPCWEVEASKDFDRLLNEQLAKLQVEHIDFYLLHALNKDSWKKMYELDVLPWAEAALADGRIGYLGFSFHDDYDAFKTIVDAGDQWTFCQIQYNYMDIENQAGTRGLRYAASKGLAVVIMEPILGGRIVNPPPSVQAIWDTAESGRSPADWALQWLWDQPEVSTVLSGMSSLQQVEENVTSAARSGVSTLTSDELKLIDQIRDQYDALSPIPCTKCQYCLPCPNGVNIPRAFEIYNQGIMYEKLDGARIDYNQWFDEDQRAHHCIECRECEEKCPQHIPISEWMPHLHAVLGEGKAIQDVPRPA
ncbi:MAG: aldo/keto reductase [Anaerolineales bacterium]|nr:aldo/keto reductase [Anaerolineales bacterium]